MNGAPHLADRALVWDRISSILAEHPNIVLIGDFNQVEFLDDKLRGSSHIPGRHSFMQWGLDNGLIDIPFSGCQFTWKNNHHDHTLSFQRLDKAYASGDWLYGHSDDTILHQPIFLRIIQLSFYVRILSPVLQSLIVLKTGVWRLGQ